MTRRVLEVIRKQTEFICGPGYMDVLRENRHHGLTNHFNDFPVPLFVKGKDKDGKMEYETDFPRYEKFLEKHPEFVEQFEERLDFLMNTLNPYVRKRKEGSVTEADEILFTQKYKRHLEREQKLWNKIASYDEGEMKKISPFDKNDVQFRMDWVGQRGAAGTLPWIERSISYLEKGWSAEDLPFLEDMEKVQQMVLSVENTVKERERQIAELEKRYEELKKEAETRRKEQEEAEISGDGEKALQCGDALKKTETFLKKTGEAIKNGQKYLAEEKEKLKRDPWEKEKKEFKRDYARLTNTQVVSQSQRRKLIENMKPYVKKFNELNKTNKGVVTQITSLDRALEHDLHPVPLSHEERQRRRMMASLMKYKKRLSTGHRVGMHKDSLEMKALKENIDKMINILKDRNHDLYGSTEVSDLMRDLAANARGYQNAKKVEAGKDIEDDTFEPKSKMGQERYAAAGELEKDAVRFANSIQEHGKEIDKGKEMKALGFETVHAGDLDYVYKKGRSYDRGMANVMNYFGKEPAFIPEHCGKSNHPFTKENFQRQCRHFELQGISHEEFALVAYAAIHNNDVIPKKLSENYAAKNILTGEPISHDDILKNRRPMFVMDYFRSSPRENVGRDFNDYTLLPAREKAYEVLKEYKQTGDKEKLAEVLATGMKEINDACNDYEHISGPQATYFSANSEMLNRLSDYIEKDPELAGKVKNKIGAEEYENIRDTLRLKSFRDQKDDAYRKLENAEAEKKPLSREEKAECIKAIVRMEFLEASRLSARNEMLGQSKDMQDFLARQVAVTMEIGLKKSPFTIDDISATGALLQSTAVKPPYKVTKALRTEQGLAELEQKIAGVAAKMDAGKSEKEILAQMKAVGEVISAKKPEKTKAAEKNAGGKQRQRETTKKKEQTARKV